MNIAQRYIDLGYEPHPLPRGKKKPPVKGWQDRTFSAEELEGKNIGIKTGKLVVLDFDNIDRAREEYLRIRHLLKTIVLTPRGVHFAFRCDEELPNRVKFTDGVDARTKGGYVVWADSVVDGKEYRFVDGHPLVALDELSVLPNEWADKLKASPAVQTCATVCRKITDVRAYISKIESIEGQNGSAGLVRAAAVCRDSGLSEAEAMVVLQDWNQSPLVSPPWSPRELARAVTRVFKKESNNAHNHRNLDE